MLIIWDNLVGLHLVNWWFIDSNKSSGAAVTDGRGLQELACDGQKTNPAATGQQPLRPVTCSLTVERHR